MASSSSSLPDDTTSSEPQQGEIMEQESIVHGKSRKTIQQIRSRRLKIFATLLVVVGIAIVALVLVITLSGQDRGNSTEPIVNAPTQGDDGSTDEEPEEPPQEQEPVLPHVPDPIVIMLLGDHYRTTRDVESELSLALDAQDMKNLNSTDTAGQLAIYTNGSRSFKYDSNGNKVPRNFADLSLKAGQNFRQHPLYHIFMQSFLEVGEHEAHEHFGDFDDRPVQEYANTLVMDLFAIRRSNYIELEAALVLNLWMAVTNELNEVLRSCKRRDASEYQHSSLDRAAALWIGNNQEFGDNDSGHLLYNFAERAGRRFGQDPDGTQGQTKVNQVIMEQFEAVQNMIREGKCSEDSDDSEAGYLEVRTALDTIVNYMTVPLVQELIHTIIQREGDWTELYALSIFPRVAFCDPNSYDALMNFMVLKDLQEEDKEAALDTIELVMKECLNIDCDMLGTYSDTSGNWFPAPENATDVIFTPCEGPKKNAVTPPKILAGYPLSENVNELANIDSDILQIRILMDSKAYDAALDYYTYGQNSRPDGKLVSLRELATSDNRKYAPQFALFSDFYGSNNYAHEIVFKAMNRAAPFDNASENQLTEIVVITLQAMVMYVAILQHLYVAVQTCKEDQFTPDKNDETKPVFGLSDYTDGHVKIWDVGAAFYVGSLEGDDEEGGSKGQLLFSAAADFCGTFGTCANIVYSRINKRIVSALIDGQNALSLDECDEAETILEKDIVPNLLVPLVQGTLFFADVNDDLPAGTDDGALGAGYAFSRSILPFVRAEDPDSLMDPQSAAEIVGSNLDFSSTAKPVKDGAAKVFDALVSTVLNGEMGVVTPMVLSRNKANITLT